MFLAWIYQTYIWFQSIFLLLQHVFLVLSIVNKKQQYFVCSWHHVVMGHHQLFFSLKLIIPQHWATHRFYSLLSNRFVSIIFVHQSSQFYIITSWTLDHDMPNSQFFTNYISTLYSTQNVMQFISFVADYIYGRLSLLAT